MKKVSMSASFWTHSRVKRFLHECDRIYTTQADNYQVLCLEFGIEKIKIIPDGTPSTIAFFAKREADRGYDVIHFPFLYHLSQMYTKE